ncbi:MAG: phage major tail tube protein [Chitinophagaceae bacterium]
MSRRVPKLINNFAIYADGFSAGASGTRFMLPDLKLKVKEHQGGGMFTPTDIVVGSEKLMATFDLVQYEAAFLALLGRENVQYTVRMYGRGSTGDEQTVVGYFTGKLIEQTGREHTVGESEYKLTHSITLTHYALEVDGAIVHDIDVQNGKFIIGGVDLCGGMNEALGLA